MSVFQRNPLPPSYSNLSTDNVHQGPSQLSDLPPYAGRRVAPTRPTYQAVPKDFNYELQQKGRPLAVVTIIADEALSRDVPTFLEHSPIKGRVKLTFDKPEIVQAVVVSVSHYMFIVLEPRL